jgi:hypothetical protein
MNTYTIEWLQDSNRIRRERMRYCMDNTNHHNLNVAIYNFSHSLQEKIRKNETNSMSNKDIEIYDFLYAVRTNENFKSWTKQAIIATKQLFELYTLATDPSKIPKLRGKYQNLALECHIKID